MAEHNASTPNSLSDDTIIRFLSGWWHFNHSMKQGIEPLLEPLGLDIRRYMLLMAIRKGTVYPKEISEKLHIPSTLLSRYIDGLVQAGFLERQIDTQDSRRTRLNVTHAAEQVLKAANEAIKTHTSDRLQHINSENLDVLLDALETLSRFTVQEK